MTRAANLSRLLRPSSIAVVGGRQAVEVVKQCQRIGFEGDLWPVNPTREDMNGVPCFKSIHDLPEAPDATFLGIPPAATIEAISALASQGAGGAVCYASGFAEHSNQGAKLQDKLLDRAGDLAIVGPNCHGFANLLDGLALWPDEMGCERTDSGAAFVMQSGNLGINLTMQDRSTPISYVICVGNSANLNAGDYINALLADPRVTVIGLHIEGLSDVEAFARAAIRANRQGVPIVALKAGRSSLGAQLTLSHTSSLAGEDQLYDALFKRLGIGRCYSLEELAETAKLLAVTGTLPRGRVASMSCSGGEAALIADYAEQVKLELPAMSDKTEAALQQQLTDKVHVSNPLDYHNYIWGDYDALKRCFSTVMNNPFDCTALVLDYPRPGVCDPAAWEITERALIDASQQSAGKAVMVASIPENLPRSARQRLLTAGVAPMQGLDNCVRALRAAVTIGIAQNNPEPPLALLPARPLPAKSHYWDEYQGKNALADFGVRIPSTFLGTGPEAVDAAESIGFPVVVKAAGNNLIHKSDSGGVHLNLNSATEVQAAINQMADLSDQFLVESMVQGAVAELMIGIKRDPLFGLALVLGSGGTLVELLQDTVTLLLPATQTELEVALDSLRVARLIRGYRGHSAGDWGLTLKAIESIIQFAVAKQDMLLELDVNPLMILPDGQTPVAVDAVIKYAGVG